MSVGNREALTVAQLLEENEALRQRLEEAEQTIEAIRQGQVDALVVVGPGGEQVYSLTGAEHVYRVIVETMHEAALTADPDGTILFCNQRFCDLMRTPMSGALGRKITTFAIGAQPSALDTVMADARKGPVQRHLSLHAADGTEVPVLISANPLETDDGASICLVASDLTELEESAGSIRHLREQRQALAESEERLRQAAQAAHFGVFDVDPANQQVYWSPELRQIAGLPADAPIPQKPGSPPDIVHPEDADRVRQLLQAAWDPDGDGIFQSEHRIVRPDSTVRWVLHKGQVQFAGQGTARRPVRFSGVMLDFTERKEAEEALRKAHDKITSILETMSDCFVTFDRDWRYTYVNAAAAKAFHVTAEQLLGETIWEIWPAAYDLPFGVNFRRSLAENVSIQFEQFYPQPLNRWFECRCQPMPEGLATFFSDITERKRVEEAIMAAHAAAVMDRNRLQAVMESLPIGVALVDAQGGNISRNAAYEQLWGGPRPPVRDVSDYAAYLAWWPDTGQPVRPEEWASARAVQSGETVLGQELEIQRFDGTRAWVLNSAAPVRNADGHITGSAVAIQDITTLRTAQEALRRSDERFRMALDAAYVISFEWDIQRNEVRRFISREPALARTEEDRPSSFKEVYKTVHPEDRRRFVAALRTAIQRDDGRYESEFRVVRPDGEVVWLYERGLVQRDAQGRAVWLIGLSQDVTARKWTEEAMRTLNTTLEARVGERTAELERRARQLQKLTLELSAAEERERKRLAEILHDDLQQQLAGTKFHLSILARRFKEDGEIHEMIQQLQAMMREAIQSSRNLSHELSPAVLYRDDLREVFVWLAAQMRTKHGLTVHVAGRDVALQSDALKAFVYKAGQELLFNVVKHAKAEEAWVRLRRVGPCIGLTVRDRGRGFDPQALSEATGFGLLSIRERVELLGGRMKIRSDPEAGSRFVISVPDRELAEQAPDMERPAQQDRAQAEEEAPMTEEPAAKVFRVVIADDHEIFRQGLVALFKEEPDIELVGEAGNGREAVDVVYETRPDVVIMDVSMPLMSGEEATRQIKASVPGTHVIGLSMFSDPLTAEKMRRVGADTCLCKADASEKLLAAIRRFRTNGG